MQRFWLYVQLVRLDKPIGILLLLWPTLWSLWLAADGKPSVGLIVIFTLGTILMRSAGCAINDWADRDFDKHVKRTAERPLTSGKLHHWEALLVAGVLSVCAFLLVLPLNTLTKELSVVALFVAGSYPFFKRFFAIPQAYLGIAFGFGIPMSFAAVQNQVPAIAWWMLVANVAWAIAYDTAYAMVDRDDDLRIGIRTSAITFGRFDVTAIMVCYAILFVVMAWVGVERQLTWPYWLGLLSAAGCAGYHYTLIEGRDRMRCFKAFLHNNWLGACLFAGVAVAYGVKN